MLHPTYENNEKIFLDDIANSWGFKDKSKLVFVQRFLSSNDDLTNVALAEVLEENLLEDAKENAVAEQIQRDYLRAIFKKMEAEGCEFNGARRDKTEIAKPWLREVVYLEWWKQLLWEQLKTRGKETDKMGPVVLTEETLDMWEPDSEYAQSVELGSRIRFEVELDRDGHLLLLERATSGKLWCLCPSLLAPKPRFEKGKAVLPQKEAPLKWFLLSGNPGKEEIVAAIAPQSPRFDWLPQPDEKPLLLQGAHLSDLLAYLEGEAECQVLYMDYEVVNNG
jgi:hypothetical protein